MRLGDITPLAPAGAADVEIADLAYDNRRVRPGSLFFCVRGFTRDGHDFAAGAVADGAAALVVDHQIDGIDAPQVVTPDVRAAMAPMAARFNGDPTATLAVAGVTGTNGKTTTAYLVRSLLEAAGRQTGLLGTVKSVVGGVSAQAGRTTPEAIDLQRTFAEMLAGGDLACAIEVSSHALELHRADAIHFAVAIFTNLTQDHLDFHGSMEDYYLAKRKLFVDCAPAAAVINIDDEYGVRLAADHALAVTPITFGIDNPNATYQATNVITDAAGARFTLRGPFGDTAVRSPLRGRFNVANLLGAIAAVVALGEAPVRTAAAVAAAAQVPGRFETVDEGQNFAVVVDYAHTPDSLENVLRAARQLTTERLHVVFGCGGDRDRGKRPLMGEIASRLADTVLVTSDNPRSEDPEAIIAEIVAGAGRAVRAEPDRRAAIAAAISSAGPGDAVVIAGKGHEQGQEFAGGEKLPFDDVTVARDALRAV